MARKAFPSFGKGTYILILRLKRGKTIKIGRLGAVRFAAGYYAYAGSALGPGGLTARLKHHLNIAQRPHWHVDYLRREAVPREVWIVEATDRFEHLWADAMQRLAGVTGLVPGFGCSDCNCPTHLLHFKKRPGFAQFKNLVVALSPEVETVQRFFLTPGGPKDAALSIENR